MIFSIYHLYWLHSDDLKNYFEKYGTVVESEVKTDHHTGQSRGFAFVTFADPSSVDAVCCFSAVIFVIRYFH